MPRFIELLRNMEGDIWQDILPTFLKYYGNQISCEYLYKQVIFYLLRLKESEIENGNENEFIYFQQISDACVSVSLKKDENLSNLSLTHWKKFVGYSIDPITIANYNNIEIIAHGLYEMTFFGFYPNSIEKFIIKLKPKNQNKIFIPL